MNRIDTPLTGDLKVVSEIMSQHVKRLSIFGFDPSEVKWEGSPKLRRYPVFGFLNRQTGMAIDFAFFSASEERNGGLVVTISKPGNHLLNVKDYSKTPWVRRTNTPLPVS
jgi:hypothetical protein